MTAIQRSTTLANLRALSPVRPLRLSEALRIAELQAARLIEWTASDIPPVSGDLISCLPHVCVVQRDDMPVSGSVHWSDGLWTIAVASHEHPRRQRFTAAHELKHVIDHRDRAILYSRLGDDAPEVVADTFAASLLMPKRLVHHAFFDGVQGLYTLARLFEVSPSAMRVRLSQLGLATRGTTSGSVVRREAA